MSRTLVAIDARLTQSTQTGDRAYWDGLLAGLRELSDPSLDLSLYFNAEPPAEIRSGPWKIHVLPAKSARWWSLVQFPLAARRAGARVVHTQYTLSPLVRRGGVSTIHDVSFFVGPEWFRARDRILLQLSIPATVRRAARILTVSETSRREIEHFIPAARGKVRVGSNGLPTWFRVVPRESAQTQVAERLGLSGPYALTVGTRWPRKNMNLAIDAVAGLPAGSSLRLAITGKPGWGDERSDARTVATGYVDDDLMGALYAAAEVYLAPSRHEGFGIPLLEAWAADCPVICSSGGALPEVAGDAAVVMPGWESADWSAALAGLLADPAKMEAMRAAGRTRRNQFQWIDAARVAAQAYHDAAQVAAQDAAGEVGA